MIVNNILQHLNLLKLLVNEIKKSIQKCFSSMLESTFMVSWTTNVTLGKFSMIVL